MPLHLLQHKSWHVGSVQNQERVKRDERNARLKEEEEERRMQLADADHRLSILRNRMETGSRVDGESVSLHLDDETLASQSTGASTTTSTPWGARERTGSSKKRRRDEEGDEIAAAISQASRGSGGKMQYRSSDAPLTDRSGHINLFPPVPTSSKSSGNVEYMAEKKRKEDELEAQYTMKLTRPSNPWYSTIDGVAEVNKAKAENLKRKEERVEKRSKEDNDPMKIIKMGVRKLREVKGEVELDRRRRDGEVGIGVGKEVEKVLYRSGNHHSGPRPDDRSREGRPGGRSRERRHRSRSRDRLRDRNSSHKDREKLDKHVRSREDSFHPDSIKYGGKSHRQRNYGSDHPNNEDNDEEEQLSSKLGNIQQSYSSIQKLREERSSREENERRKAQLLVEQEMSFRKPETWIASSAGGKGKYSRQFGA